ncbi:very short patch repair endonuclease [Burkholderia gladioli]|uniref:very short patch repair endonuclease n=1 Tax=Burkholderia gladioli TaxID=28095 RepID=UPI00156065D0|nr:DNA mismatch endonuclease Vsr [Burkholderia gladioli]NRF89138.1 DNA mismatch endonuclease Vsr [Burkholderia gladioli]
MTDSVSRAQRSRNMAAVRSSNTKPEKVVRSILHRLGLRFRLNQKTLPGTPDIVLRRHATVVLVHGCFWHGHDCPRGKLPETRREFWIPKLQRNRERDLDNERRLLEQGWRVLIVWECELRKPDQLRGRLAEAFSVPE